MMWILKFFKTSFVQLGKLCALALGHKMGEIHLLPSKNFWNGKQREYPQVTWLWRETPESLDSGLYGTAAFWLLRYGADSLDAYCFSLNSLLLDGAQGRTSWGWKMPAVVELYLIKGNNNKAFHPALSNFSLAVWRACGAGRFIKKVVWLETNGRQLVRWLLESSWWDGSWKTARLLSLPGVHRAEPAKDILTEWS